MAAPGLAPGVDPYQSISPQAFELTFDDLLKRPDCDARRQGILLHAKAEFQRSGGVGKAEAMQSLLSAYPTDTVATMTKHVQNIKQAPPQRPAALPPGMASLPPGISQQHFAVLYQQQLQQQRLKQQQQQTHQTVLAQQLAQSQALAASAAKRARPDGGPEGPGLAKDAKTAAAGAGGVPGKPGDVVPKQVKPVDDDMAIEGPDERDALSNVGVNLMAEQEALMMTGGGAARHLRNLKDVMPKHADEYVLNHTPLNQLMRKVAMRHGLSGVDAACATYLSMAVEAHLGRLLTSMARVAMQRHDPARNYEGVEPRGPNTAGRLQHLQDGAPDAPPHPPTSSSSQQGEPSSSADPGTSQALQAAAAAPQSHLAFRRQRPLLVRTQDNSPSERFVGLVRQLDPTSTLSCSSAQRPPGGSSAVQDQAPAGSGPGAGGVAVLALEDLVAALEKDSLLSKHPLVWRLHPKLTAPTKEAP